MWCDKMKWKYSIGGYEVVIERKYGYGTTDDVKVVLRMLVRLLETRRRSSASFFS